eukprot:CAMPEP_0174385570 /NCGR_PEP_ID=MMETSP0811_2-20130205/126694_1 /TAXON_ID=73025 ORGANISM="Eutreptiella gymnastica-like, Strain CCMP1594" /NCGR_SAMPLE_ID=MMETSP0811_2 /ASSEMBLY_ACC=CAM_ASM_000667 /LENGTH=107 /DNA_ID=CAMNT_0015539941 /DNA_START=766 /DNA_END=1089 /DNA_ORIENTATION=+
MCSMCFQIGVHLDVSMGLAQSGIGVMLQAATGQVRAGACEIWTHHHRNHIKCISHPGRMWCGAQGTGGIQAFALPAWSPSPFLLPQVSGFGAGGCAGASVILMGFRA